MTSTSNNTTLKHKITIQHFVINFFDNI